MNSKRFIVGDVLGFGWQVMKNNFCFLMGIGLVVYILSYALMIPQLVLKGLEYSEDTVQTVRWLLMPLGWVIASTSLLGINSAKQCPSSESRDYRGPSGASH